MHPQNYHISQVDHNGNIIKQYANGYEIQKFMLCNKEHVPFPKRANPDYSSQIADIGKNW